MAECPASQQPLACSSDSALRSSSACPYADGVSSSSSPPSSSAPVSSDVPLNKIRSLSTIPRAESKENWIYPSERMFYDAMLRKKRDPRAEDMKYVVPIHNAVNEMAWRQILEWESYTSPKSRPSLSKFQGMPGKWTPRSFFRTAVLGYKAPFDRHDWTIERDGQKINYVIDFYSGHRTPGMDPTHPTFHLDTRPKLDTWLGFKLRAYRFFADMLGLSQVHLVKPPPNLAKKASENSQIVSHSNTEIESDKSLGLSPAKK